MQFSPGYALLPPEFYEQRKPTPLPDPYLVALSPDAAKLVGIDPAMAELRLAYDVLSRSSEWITLIASVTTPRTLPLLV